MGLFTRKESNTSKSDLLAQYAPQVLTSNYSYIMSPMIDRAAALEIPSVVRARNLITATIAAMPLELYRKSTGEELGKPVWMDQPASNQPRAVTIAYTVDSLLFYGWALWKITSRYSEDGRPASFEWIPNSRVTPQYEGFNNYYIAGYEIDGVFHSNDDVVTFQSLNDGILTTGARVLRGALDLEIASTLAAATPMPSGYIKNTGADLDPKEVQGLLAAWKSARQNRSTAYLTSTLEYSPTSFTPKDMMYNEAVQNFSTQIARSMNVPAYYLSADQNTTMTYANVQDERKQFYALSIEPYVQAIQSRLSMDDISTSGHEVRFAVFDTFLKNDPLVELQVIEKLLSLGLITTEQAMEMSDLTPNGSEGIS